MMMKDDEGTIHYAALVVVYIIPLMTIASVYLLFTSEGTSDKIPTNDEEDTEDDSNEEDGEGGSDTSSVKSDDYIYKDGTTKG
jgi:hypothetical protein